MIAPCKDCEKRVVGCHSSCEEYKKFREFRNELNEKRHIENQTSCFTVSYEKYIRKGKRDEEKLRFRKFK